MLNPEAKLIQNPFPADSKELKMVATRDGYGEGLVLAGDENPNVVVLCADLTESTRSLAFAKKYPERFFEVGVAEQNMATIAAGLGVSGKVVFISSYACFSPGRNWEQIRTTIAYNDSNVKIAGAHAGLMTGPDGATHQMLEDIAIMRAMPNMKVLAPCDAIETKKAVLAAARIYGPVYIRFGREKSPLFTTEETPFEIGKALCLWNPEDDKPDVAIIACGTLVYNALKAGKELEDEGIKTCVINSPSIKPLDEETIINAAKKAGAVVTVEEHQITGGLGGAVAECLAKNYPVPIEFIGVKDSFGESGGPWELVEKYGMGVSYIKEAVRRVIARKSF
jgi:transketolase